MNLNYIFIKQALRQKIADNLCGSCIGCLLDIDDDHSCELNCQNLISQFELSFNIEKSARLEVFRLKLIFDLLSELEEDRREVRRQFKNYKKANPVFISEKENFVPIKG